MVNLEKMLRQLMESQLQRAEGRPLPVEEEVVDLEPPEVMQPESLVDLTDHRIPESGQLTERRLTSTIKREPHIDQQVGTLKHGMPPHSRPIRGMNWGDLTTRMLPSNCIFQPARKRSIWLPILPRC